MTPAAKIALALDCDGALSSTVNAQPQKLLKWLTRWITGGVAGLRHLAPYAAIEFLLPGGSVLALILWLYRRQKSKGKSVKKCRGEPFGRSTPHID